MTFVRSPFAHARITGVDASAAEALPNVQVLTGADVDGVADRPAADPRARAADGASDRRQGRRSLRRRHRRGRPQRGPSIRRWTPPSSSWSTTTRCRSSLDPRRLRRTSCCSSRTSGRTSRAAPARMEHDADAVRGLRRRRLGHARQPADGRLPARGALGCGRGRTDGRVTAWLSTQVPHRDQDGLCRDARARSGRAAHHRAGRRRRLRGEERLRRRGGAHRLARAKNLGTPVRWTETRTENMIALPHGRGQWLELTLGGTRDGKVLAYRARRHAGRRRVPGRRRLPAEPHRRCSRAASTRSPDRGRGTLGRHEHDADDDVPRRRPARGSAGDRAHDRSVRGRDRAWIRSRCGARTSSRRTRSRTQTASGATYDSGDYEGALDLALRSAGYDELRAEQKRRRERGRSEASSASASPPTRRSRTRSARPSSARSRSRRTAGAIVHTGSFSHGQGHETTFAMIAAERLGLPVEKVAVVKGDTDEVPQGTGTFGSKSTQIGGTAARVAADERRRDRRSSSPPTTSRRARPTWCSTRPSAASTSPGRADPSLSWAELAARAGADDRLGELKVADEFRRAADVPVRRAHRGRRGGRRDRARSSSQRFVAVDDAGTLINPLRRRGPGARRRRDGRRAGALRGLRLRRGRQRR